MFQFNRSADEEFEILQGCVRQLRARYEIIAEDLPVLNWGNFELLKHYTNLLNRQTVKFENRKLYVCFIETELATKSSKGGLTYIKELKVFIFHFLDEKYGHILIRKENLEDKVNEF